MKNWLPLTMLWAPLLASNALAAPPPKAAIAFEDQFERTQDIAQLQGDVVVVIYGDSYAMSTNVLLGDKIHLAYHPSAKNMPPEKAGKAPVSPLPELKEGMRSPDVRIVPIVCYGKTTDPIKNYLRQRLKKQFPETAMLMDFENKMKQEFDLKYAEPNLLVIDAAGRLRLKMNGEQIPASYAKVIHAIDFLRQEAAAGR
jgi:hypothetical protein